MIACGGARSRCKDLSGNPRDAWFPQSSATLTHGSRCCCWKPVSNSPSRLHRQIHDTAKNQCRSARVSTEHHDERLGKFATRDASVIRDVTSTGACSSWKEAFMGQFAPQVNDSTHQPTVELLFHDNLGYDNWDRATTWPIK